MDRHQFNAEGEHVARLCDACNSQGLNVLTYEEVRELLFAALDRGTLCPSA